MGKTLNIVERAYQGTLEEQDDQAIWIIHAMKNAGREAQVVLRGAAVNYAVREQNVGPLEIGGVKAGNPPRIDEDLKKVAAKGVELFAVREDAQARGISPEDAIAEVKWISKSDMVAMIQQAERVFAW